MLVNGWLAQIPFLRRLYTQKCCQSMRRLNKSRHTMSSNANQLLSRRIRFTFIGVAFPFLSLAALCLIIVLIDGHLVADGLLDRQTMFGQFRLLLLNHRSIVIFLSVTFALLQTLAIAAALFNWSMILFAYVVIVGILGTIVGIVGLFGILFSCLFMNHHSTADHSIAITITVLILFIVIFYLLTILGIKLIERLRKKSVALKKKSPVNVHSTYKSIDTICTPFDSVDCQFNDKEWWQQQSAKYKAENNHSSLMDI